MKITTFFIDRFEEVSLTTPAGVQEEGGVYGDESNYSSWLLGIEGDTTDFEGIVKTNILYGELYKITLDTGNLFNPQIPGGVPNINGFMNMDLNEYWQNIVNGTFTFNERKYQDYKASLPPKGVVPGLGGVGGGGTPSTPDPSLLEYAMGVKERVGWVEVNRTRPSIYYEACSGGKRARSDHFYDVTKFIMTPELFDLNNTNSVTNFEYQNINPYTGQNERYYSVNQFSVSKTPGFSPTSKLGLNPVGNWFTWINNTQGHFRTFNNVPENIGGYLDTFPWPRGQSWGNYSGVPKDYLISIITGNQLVLNADAKTDPIIQKLPLPSGISNLIGGIPLLIARKSNHLNTLLPDRLANQTEFGTLSPISPVYSVNIWGEKRNPEQATTITLGFSSNLKTPSFGVCQSVAGLEITTSVGGGGVSILDPFGFDLYELDKEYQEVYSKFKFCPPRKKINNSLGINLPPKNTPLTTDVVKRSVGNMEEISFSNERLIKIGVFNPDEPLLFDLKEEKPFKGIDKNNQSSVFEINYNKIDKMTIEDVDVYDPKTDKTYFYSYLITGDYKPKDYFLDDDESSKTQFISRINQFYINDLEVEYGVRSPEQPLLTDVKIPYGTYKIKNENIKDSYGNEITTTKIMRNGSDAEPTEFKNTVSSIISLAGNDKVYPDPIGVDSNGAPIFPRNTLESSINKLKEDLTGVKEIIFRGSDVNVGSVYLPRMIDRSNLASPDSDIFSTGVSKVIEYVNTGINSKGVVDLNTGEKLEVANFYGHSIFQYIEGIFPKNVTRNKFFEDKEKKLLLGNIDFIGTYKNWKPYSYVKSQGEKSALYDITHILVSKYDLLGVKKESWASTSENPKGSPIKSSNTGTIFLESRAPNQIYDNYIFNIVGEPLEFDTYYKIPVKFISSTYDQVPSSNDSLVKNAAFLVRYSPQITDKKPSDQKVSTSVKNTYGGWRFSGLWHRDGSWPEDHDYRSGLLGGTGFGGIYWDPSQGGVNTGAWIRVPPERVRLEYHTFGKHSEESINAYIHRLWLKEKDRIFTIEQEKSKMYAVNYQMKISEYADALDNQIYSESGFTHPLNVKYQPDVNNSNTWEDWERRLDAIRSSLIESVKDIKSTVLVLYLRDNSGDPSRNMQPLDNKGWYWGGRPRYFTSDDVPPNWKEGHMMEQWIIANKITENESIMNDSSNYWMWWYPEPTEHTKGQFKKDEWYRAVFVKAITSPSNPKGELAGFDKYPVNEFNKKTLCDLIYVSEQILKMQRARLVELKKYIDNRENFYGDKDTEGNYNNPSFIRSMTFVKGFKKIINLFK